MLVYDKYNGIIEVEPFNLLFYLFIYIVQCTQEIVLGNIPKGLFIMIIEIDVILLQTILCQYNFFHRNTR
jgi:hypothetical protein